MKVVLEISFLTPSNMDISFGEKKLIWRTYVVAEDLFPIKNIKLIDKKDFVKAVLNKDVEAFVVYISLWA